MNLFKVSFRSLPLEIVKLLIIISTDFFAASQWTKNTMYASILIVSSMIVYLALTWLFQIRRAIFVEFKLNNLKTKKENTEIHQTSKEKELTIKIDFKLERRSSLFWRIGYWYIRNKRIQVRIYPTSEELVLTPKMRASLPEITDDLEGFKVDISNLFNNTLMENKVFPHKRTYEFVVKVKRGIDVTPDRQVSIHTNILLNEKPVGTFFKLLFETKYGSHEIEIYP